VTWLLCDEDPWLWWKGDVLPVEALLVGVGVVGGVFFLEELLLLLPPALLFDAAEFELLLFPFPPPDDFCFCCCCCCCCCLHFALRFLNQTFKVMRKVEWQHAFVKKTTQKFSVKQIRLQTFAIIRKMWSQFKAR